MGLAIIIGSILACKHVAVAAEELKEVSQRISRRDEVLLTS